MKTFNDKALQRMVSDSHNLVGSRLRTARNRIMQCEVGLISESELRKALGSLLLDQMGE